jgi:hypothetical protein
MCTYRHSSILLGLERYHVIVFTYIFIFVYTYVLYLYRYFRQIITRESRYFGRSFEIKKLPIIIRGTKDI